MYKGSSKYPVTNKFAERAMRNSDNARLANMLDNRLSKFQSPAIEALNSIAEKVSVLNSMSEKVNAFYTASQAYSPISNNMQNLAEMSKINEMRLANEKINGLLSAQEKINLVSESAAFKLPGLLSEINKVRNALSFTSSGNYIQNTLAEYHNMHVAYYHLVNTGFVKTATFDEVEEEIEAEKKESSIIMLDNTIRIRGLIKSVYDDNSKLFTVKPREFEFMIAELLEAYGLIVNVTAQTRDGGYDILAIDEKGFTTNKYLIECKRNRQDRPVDVNVVKLLRTTVLDQGANKGIIFTTSHFTSEAEKMRKDHEYLIDLKNGTNVLDWVRAYVNKTLKLQGGLLIK